jgi:thiosulfate reductase cytochrome b subunit
VSAADPALAAAAAPAAPRPAEPVVIYRHSLLVRITHWTNVLAILVLLLSGLQIFNAHPRLYWGQAGANADPAWVAMSARPDGQGGLRGFTQIGPVTIETTGVLGASKYQGRWQNRGFPGWLTLPTYRDLTTGRLWHFFFAWVFVLNGLVYLLNAVISGHLRRNLIPARDQLTARHIVRNVIDHVRLRHAVGEEARRYNILQKGAYLIVIFGLLPLMLITGLSMSPGFNAAAPWLTDLLGGRQSGRTLHFISAILIVLFVVVHVVEVFLAGVVNEMRSMITGRYRVPEGPHA